MLLTKSYAASMPDEKEGLMAGLALVYPIACASKRISAIQYRPLILYIT